MVRRLLLWFSICLLVAGVCAVWVVPAAGRYLVRDDGPAKADAALVLAGDFRGWRVRKAGDLVRAGYVPRAIVSGPRWIYETAECNLAIAMAAKHGYPESYFEGWPNDALSTDDEARLFGAMMRQRGAKRILLVTSDYHTRRAGRIFRRTLPDFEIRTVAARDAYYRPDLWWDNRESRKIFVIEWAKTVAQWLGQ